MEEKPLGGRLELPSQPPPPPLLTERLIKRLRNENEDKTKTQMTQSFNQYFENETKIWRQNIRNQFNRVSSSCFRSHFVIERLRNENEDKTKTHVELI